MDVAIIVLSLLAAIVLSILFIPSRTRAKMKPAGKFVHDLINFRHFFIADVLKFLYIFLTVFVVLTGFFGLFQDYSEPLACLLLMLLGPVVVRLIYESFMMFISLVENVGSINRKIQDNPSAPKTEGTPVAPAAPVTPVAPAEPVCPRCGAKVDADAKFCTTCGQVLN